MNLKDFRHCVSSIGPAKTLPCSWDPGHKKNRHLEFSSRWGGGCFVPTLLLCTQTLCGDCISLKISPRAFLVSHRLIKGLFLTLPTQQG